MAGNNAAAGRARRSLTSESVTEGHPDKMCDQISDAILDAIYAKDPMARVACETMVCTGLVLVAGQITTDCYVDIPAIVRQTIREIGYTRAKYGFDCDTCAVLTSIDEQSGDIAVGVDHSIEARAPEEAAPNGFDTVGAGDQGIVYGYATDETVEMLPLPLVLAHRLARRLAEVRKSNILPYLRPDGKSQVTIDYDGSTPVRASSIVVSTQHHPKVEQDKLRQDIAELVVRHAIPAELLDERTRLFVNPTGRFVVGGPQGDTGLTGRKIMVDTYGGLARHGGGCFSGKDPTKVDRSGAYMARYAAKNVVAAGLAARCELQVSYCIGKARPVSVSVDTLGTNRVPEESIRRAVEEVFDFRPAAIIEALGLRRPLYKQTACYGHFGRTDLDLPWERTDRAEALRTAASS